MVLVGTRRIASLWLSSLVGWAGCGCGLVGWAGCGCGLVVGAGSGLLGRQGSGLVVGAGSGLLGRAGSGLVVGAHVFMMLRLRVRVWVPVVRHISLSLLLRLFVDRNHAAANLIFGKNWFSDTSQVDTDGSANDRVFSNEVLVEMVLIDHHP